MAETETQATERLLKLSDADLMELAHDEGQRDMVRDIAHGILATRDKEVMEPATGDLQQRLDDLERDIHLPQADGAAVVQALEEQLAKEHVERQAAREAAHAVGAVERALNDMGYAKADAPAPEKTPNQVAAEGFMQWLDHQGMSGITVSRTLSVQGARVVDGWVVNFHDHVQEIGFVACFWGRGHFVAYVEIAGHMERASDAATAFLAAWNANRTDG